MTREFNPLGKGSLNDVALSFSRNSNVYNIISKEVKHATKSEHKLDLKKERSSMCKSHLTLNNLVSLYRVKCVSIIDTIKEAMDLLDQRELCSTLPGADEA